LAWFVIGMGALLGLGGATALLFGFEIMMTERGMAMTISGVVALTGSAITLALGFILKRMGQLLKALKDRDSRAVPSKSLDRPIVPVISELATEPATAKPGLLGAGAALGAATALGGAALALGGAGAAHAQESATEGGAEAQAELPLADIEIPALPVAAPAEFEAELQRALADADVVTPEPDVEIIDDLTRLLNREPPKTGVEDAAHDAGEPAEPDVTDDDADAAQEADESDTEGQKTDEEEAEVALATSEGEEDSEPEDAKDNDAQEETVVEAPEDTDEASLVIEQDEPETSPSEAPSDQALQPKPAILGSYKAGGRTYTMYADGKVEAITDDGVERFDSLDALRKHLAET
jgi:hypothetical protein